MPVIATQYPAYYGCVPGTLGEDGDPFDALLLVQERRGPDRAAGAVNARLCFSLRLAADPGAGGTYIR